MQLLHQHRLPMTVRRHLCASCVPVVVAPQLLKLMDQFPDIVFLKVDFDNNKAMCKTLGVKVRRFVLDWVCLRIHVWTPSGCHAFSLHFLLLANPYHPQTLLNPTTTIPTNPTTTPTGAALLPRLPRG